ncbi:hypothetical protein ACJEIK_28755 [Mycobacterium sp. SMC-16]|uniref:hypothetical protein n=1 Tax=Mycobacteriaceae TaxID=1762 RepID=UPI002269EBCC|nr:hypothetical protein [Mycolicibacterium mucogenicum]MCX8558922.1 hypothetical protein [Mycolicibacterium mucogenicum]
MDLRKATLFAAAGMAAGMLVAPAAQADICDPSVTVCQGSEISGPTSVPAASPPVIASDDAFPFGDDEWYLYPGAGVINRGGGGGHR